MHFTYPEAHTEAQRSLTRVYEQRELIRLNYIQTKGARYSIAARCQDMRIITGGRRGEVRGTESISRDGAIERKG